jgi:hypothetical protein
MQGFIYLFHSYIFFLWKRLHGKCSEENSHSPIEVLSWHLAVRIKENQKKTASRVDVPVKIESISQIQVATEPNRLSGDKI